MHSHEPLYIHTLTTRTTPLTVDSSRMGADDLVDLDWELEQLVDDADSEPGVGDPMDIDWDLDHPLNDDSDDNPGALDKIGLLQFAAIAGADCSMLAMYELVLGL